VVVKKEECLVSVHFILLANWGHATILNDITRQTMRHGPGQTWARLAVLGENNAQFLELDPDIPATMKIVREKLRFVFSILSRMLVESATLNSMVEGQTLWEYR
jgi:hypothetical protein